eukprot:scaffold1741_cov262-Pinguiococcus_pyrenoidosus.AAC.34
MMIICIFKYCDVCSFSLLIDDKALQRHSWSFGFCFSRRAWRKASQPSPPQLHLGKGAAKVLLCASVPGERSVSVLLRRERVEQASVLRTIDVRSAMLASLLSLSALGAVLCRATARPSEAFLMSSSLGSSGRFSAKPMSAEQLCDMLEAEAQKASTEQVWVLEEPSAFAAAGPQHPVAQILPQARSSSIFPEVQGLGTRTVAETCAGRGLSFAQVATAAELQQPLTGERPFVALWHRSFAPKQSRRLQGTDSDEPQKRFLRFTPEIIAILVVTLIFLIILFTGLCCMAGIQTPQKLISKGFTKPFKEY